MAQMFSSGVTPDYLKSLSDAYAQYFPQQIPVNTQALQDWYSPSGSLAAAVPSVSNSVVGSLFGDQYPQVHQGGNSQVDTGPGYASPSTQSFGAGLASAGINYGSLLGGLMPYGALTKALGNAYVNSQLSNAALNGGYTGTYTGQAAFGDRPNNLATEGGVGPLTGGGFGPTGGNMGYSGDNSGDNRGWGSRDAG